MSSALQQTEKAALKQARRRASHRIAFTGHLIVFGAIVMLLLFAAGMFTATIVGLAWGLGVAMHWFWAIKAPQLHRHWVAEELGPQVQATVARERETLGSDHARHMNQLSAAVAHEIRNPITAAKSLVQQMGEDPNADHNVEYARVAIEELDRVERSIAQLLRYAREQDVKLSPVRLGDAVRSALEAMQQPLASIEVEVTLVDEDRMRGDLEALRRVIINLLNNAIDAIAERGPPEPRLVVHTGHNLAGTELWLRVRDNGGGIDPEAQATLFEPFFTTKQSGTGLGLAICKRLVQAHEGRIEVTPAAELEEGCEFVLTFPMQADAA